MSLSPSEDCRCETTVSQSDKFRHVSGSTKLKFIPVIAVSSWHLYYQPTSISWLYCAIGELHSAIGLSLLWDRCMILRYINFRYQSVYLSTKWKSNQTDSTLIKSRCKFVILTPMWRADVAGQRSTSYQSTEVSPSPQCWSCVNIHRYTTWWQHLAQSAHHTSIRVSCLLYTGAIILKAFSRYASRHLQDTWTLPAIFVGNMSSLNDMLTKMLNTSLVHWSWTIPWYIAMTLW